MDKEITIKIKNDIAELERIDQIVEEFGVFHQLPFKTLFHVKLVLEELLINTISYGYTDDREHHIAVNIKIHEGSLLLIITDDGAYFNPLEAPQPDIDAPMEGRTIGGLGIHLVKSLMDDLTYKREKGQNIVFLKKTMT